MSKSREDLAIQTTPWLVVLHQFNFEISPAVLIAESLLSDLQLKVSEKDKGPLLALSKTLQEINELSQRDLENEDYKVKEPDQALIDEKVREFQGLLDLALRDANLYSYIRNTADPDEKTAIDDIIQSIKQAQLYLDPSYLSPAISLQDLIEKKRSHYTFMLHKKKNELKLIFNPPDLNAVIKGEYVKYLNSILENCLANANRFTTNGEIEVKIQLADTADKFQIIIKDNGLGMEAEILKRIRKGEGGVTVGGHGIGLAGVYVDTVKYGGTLSIDSNTDTINHGTIFTYELPANLMFERKIKKLAPKTQAKALPSIFSSGSIESHGLIESKDKKQFSIYFVDDTLVNRKLFIRSIAPLMKNRNNIEVIAIEDPFEILKMSDEEIGKIIGIITDVNLGNNVNGKDLACDQIHPRLTGKVPIFTYSGNNVVLEQGSKLAGHIFKGAPIKAALEVFLGLADQAALEKRNSAQQTQTIPSAISAAASTGAGTVIQPAHVLSSASVRSETPSLPSLAKSPSVRSYPGVGLTAASSTGTKPSADMKKFQNKKQESQHVDEKNSQLAKRSLFSLPKININFPVKEESHLKQKKIIKASKKKGFHF